MAVVITTEPVGAVGLVRDGDVAAAHGAALAAGRRGAQRHLEAEPSRNFWKHPKLEGLFLRRVENGGQFGKRKCGGIFIEAAKGGGAEVMT